jgi:hypothetical protein
MTATEALAYYAAQSPIFPIRARWLVTWAICHTTLPASSESHEA